MKIASFETDLTDAQWEYLQCMLPKRKKLGRPPTDRRPVVNAILYILKGGIAWRLLPKNFPPWQTVYDVFRAWSLDRTWAAINDALRLCTRTDHGRHAQPSAAILDSQSVKSDGHGGTVGYDAGKKIKGRKRHLLVDTLGLVLGVVVTPADCPERDGAQQVLRRVGGWFRRLRKLWVDGGYTGEPFAQWVRTHWPKLEVEVVKRSDTATGFAVLPRRWIVERTFGWLMRHRRLVRDYERTEASAESWIYLAMIRIQLRRLA
jgi:putative transposase